MTRAHKVLRLAAAGLIGGSCLAGSIPAVAADTMVLAPHRAVYDLTLSKSRGKRPIQMVRGRILYDFNGSACEGYSLQFRQVSEIDNGEGKQALSDLRAATWEDGEGKSFRFNSENKIDSRVADSVDGNAERDTTGVAVKLTKPKAGSFALDAKTAFPTEQIKRVIEAAEAGRSLLELPVYDGSETGDKVFQTLSVIGKVILPGDKNPDDAAANNSVLAGLKRWPVTISYFEQRGANPTGEQTPVYAIGFELYENGISRALTLDYGDFVVSGVMSQLDIRELAPCK